MNKIPMNGHYTRTLRMLTYFIKIQVRLMIVQSTLNPGTKFNLELGARRHLQARLKINLEL